MKISFRQKTAGKREAKKVSGLNFEEIRKRLISEGIDPTPEEIKARMPDEGYLVISEKQKSTINSIDISESAKKRVNEVESALIVIGAVLSNEYESDAKSDIEVFEWYLETFELQPGKLGISDADIKDIISIKKVYEKIYSEVTDKKRKSDEAASAASDDNYISNEVVYDLGEGWRVVYVPAAGEMEPYPGYPDTSHDRILEGNKNGLCLGSETRYYQNNKDGKIYSVRDPSNKPRVTIRILNKKLEEAKGKNNNSPDILGAIKADAWFKTFMGLDYKESDDYKLFPPLNIEDARKRFVKSPILAYNHGWVPHWYNNGIKEIDEDVEKKIENLDKKIIMGGFGKYPKFFDRAKPIVIHWCNKYLNGDIYAEDIIFGFHEIHEIYKTYKKLREMQLAVKKLSESEKAYKFIELNLHKIKEYEQYIKNPAEKFVLKNTTDFLENFSEEPWAQPYLDFAAKTAVEDNALDFIRRFSDKPWAQPYLGIAAKNLAENYPNEFLFHSHKPWAQPYLGIAAKSYASIDPEYLLVNFSEEPWAKPYLDLATKNLATNDIQYFLRYFSEKPWAQFYLGTAARNVAKNYPYYFLEYFSDKSWAKPYLDLAKSRTEGDYAKEDPEDFLYQFENEPWAKPHLDLAAKSLAEKNPDYFIEYYSDKPWAQPYIDLAKSKLENKEASNSIQAKLLKLSKFLKSNNLEEYNYLNYYKV